ncbi:MAG: hypothetical protein HP477_10880 [Nitrospira sp.]|nr:hypothetical protein [Nitrospira sp.]
MKNSGAWSARHGLICRDLNSRELAYYEGLSRAEIAARLNEPLDTVKTRIKLGMSKLHDALRGYWEQAGSI